MKTRFFFIFALSLALAAGLCRAQGGYPVVAENPFVAASNTDAIQFQRIELTDTATIVWGKAVGDAGSTYRISGNSRLMEAGKVYPIFRADSIALGEWFSLPQSGTQPFVLYFAPLPANVHAFNFTEGSAPGEWRLYGIFTGDRAPKEKELLLYEQQLKEDCKSPSDVQMLSEHFFGPGFFEEFILPLVVVSIVCFLAPIVVIVLVVRYFIKKRTLRKEIEEKRLQVVREAIAAGQPLPASFFEAESAGQKKDYLKSGVVKTFVGIGIAFLFNMTDSEFLIGVGLLVMFWGMGQLVFYYLKNREAGKSTLKSVDLLKNGIMCCAAGVGIAVLFSFVHMRLMVGVSLLLFFVGAGELCYYYLSRKNTAAEPTEPNEPNEQAAAAAPAAPAADAAEEAKEEKEKEEEENSSDAQE